MILKLGMKHQGEELYKVYINHDLGMTLTGCPVLLFFLFFPIFSGLPIFSYILIPNPIFFHQIPIFFKMLQIIMKYQGKIMEFWFEMPVLMSLAFIFFLARFARS